MYTNILVHMYTYKFLYMKSGGGGVAEDTGAMDADNEGEMDAGMNNAPELGANMYTNIHIIFTYIYIYMCTYDIYISSYEFDWVCVYINIIHIDVYVYTYICILL